MKCGKKSSGKMSKDTKRKLVLTYDTQKMKSWETKKRKENCKDMKDYNMVENENKEVGQHVLLAQVFLELY